MNPLNDSHKSRPSRLSRLALASPPILIDGKIFESAKGWRFAPGLFATLTLLILPFGAAQLLAQQAPQQDWPPDDAPNGQYSTGQQPGYTQPQYAQAPQYGQQQGYSQPYQGSAQPFAQQGYGEAQPLNADQLEQMVAPIALYPDSLVAQILAASTYPAQVSAADQWLQAQGNAPPEQIAAGASAQTSWDPSIKALTAFPQVLAMLDRNLQWTTSLGNAYYNQPQDVLQTIQVMRERAEQAGNLQSTPQAEVSNNQGYIDIAPPNPQVVYVPAYNPWDVYGQPVAPYPGFSLMGALGSFFGSSPVQYGMGIAMSAFMNTPFGWLGWGLDWLAHSILFNHGDYFTHSRSVTDWGFPHGGPRAYPGRPEWSRGRNENGWSHEGYNRQGSGYSRGYGQTFANRGNDGYNRSYGQTFAHTPDRYRDARTAEGFNRGFPSRGDVYGRPALPTQQAYNRFPQPAGRSEQFASRGYGSGYETRYGSESYSRQGENYGGRSGMSYTAPERSYRSPESNYQRDGFEGRNYSGSEGYARSQKSGGFHLFGHGNQAQKFNYGGRESRSFSYGGHGSGGFKAPKASHFGGGGHSGGHGGGHGGGGGHGHHH
ncbi:MAG: DUF3300 domain-containing protein [Terracidiphilus sp.]